MKITAIATQSEGWWAIEVPELGFMTQAKRLTEIESMSRSLAVDLLQIEPEAVEVDVNIVLEDEAAEAVNAAREQMRDAQQQLAAASKASFDAVNVLRHDSGLTVREVAQLLQISAGRVTQIEQKKAPAAGAKPVSQNLRVFGYSEVKPTDLAFAARFTRKPLRVHFE